MRERSGICCPLDPATGRKPAKVRTESFVLTIFKPVATFQNAVDLYIFDKQLRLLALDALERIEVALRADVSHHRRQDRFAYLKPDLFHHSFSAALDPKTGLTTHHDWLLHQAWLINRSKENSSSTANRAAMACRWRSGWPARSGTSRSPLRGIEGSRPDHRSTPARSSAMRRAWT
ncbi:MAG: Abi family protein [Sphaerotilus natans]